MNETEFHKTELISVGRDSFWYILYNITFTLWAVNFEIKFYNRLRMEMFLKYRLQ